jgi:hypothetical protein
MLGQTPGDGGADRGDDGGQTRRTMGSDPGKGCEDEEHRDSASSRRVILNFY